jgi:hypothetical protein
MWMRAGSLASAALLALPVSALATPPAIPGYVGCRLDTRSGEILALVPAGPAERAGLRVGDVITAIDGSPVSDGQAIAGRFATSTPDSVLRLTVARDGKNREVGLRVGRSSAQPPSGPIEDLRIKLVTSRDYRAEPGDEVDFPVIYEVGGDQPVQVTERREIVKDGRVLASWEDKYTRAPGKTISHRVFQVPQTAPGHYTARATLSIGGRQIRAYAWDELAVSVDPKLYSMLDPAALKRRPLIEILNVGIEPAMAAPGQEVVFGLNLVVNDQKHVDVTERREILKDGQLLASWEDTFSRHPLNSYSVKPIRLPPDASAGRYTARVILRANGQEFRKDAEFEVR